MFDCHTVAPISSQIWAKNLPLLFNFFVCVYNELSYHDLSSAWLLQQKLAQKDGGRIDRNRDAQYLWDFYQRYKRVHRVDEIQKEEQKMLESGTFSAAMGGYAFSLLW